MTETRTYVESVREEIQAIRDRIQSRVTAGVYSIGAIDPHEEIVAAGGFWSQVETALAGIFGTTNDQVTAKESFLGDPPTGRRDDNLDADEVDDVLDVLDGILDSLSTLTKFEDDIYGELITDASAEEAFGAAISKLQFGSSSNTRFAAYAIQSDGGSASGADPAPQWDVGAFAYSPLEVSNRTMLPKRGEATFEGDTIAVQASITTGGTPTLYSGDIELRVRFSTGRVLGFIDNLRDEDNDRWTYNGTEVESIRLPIGEMADGTDADATFEANANGVSDLRFVTETPSSTFQGKFVGDDTDEADAVLGTWSIVELAGVQGAISGAFGAEYHLTRTSPKPDLESSPRGSRSEISIDSGPDADGEIELGSFTGIDASRLYSRSNTVLRSTDANQTLSVNLTMGQSLELTVHYRKTHYTRYGVWSEELQDDETVVKNGQGVFAYSHLEATVFSDELDSDYVYPENVTATYSGQTIAMDSADDPVTYLGSIEMTVNWNSGAAQAGFDSVVIRNLRSISGNNYFAVNGDAVDRIVLTGSVNFTDANDGLRFDSSPTAEVWYRDPLLTRSNLGGSHSGNFVGVSIDGPVGVIGKWSVTDNVAPIEGAYGAELQP